jgi:hypothetical protein
MSKKDSKPEKAGSGKRAMAERQEAEDNVKKNMERLRALRIEREAQKKTGSEKVFDAEVATRASGIGGMPCLVSLSVFSAIGGWSSNPERN